MNLKTEKKNKNHKALSHRDSTNTILFSPICEDQKKTSINGKGTFQNTATPRASKTQLMSSEKQTQLS